MTRGAPNHQGIVTAANKNVGRGSRIVEPECGVIAVPTEGLHVVHCAGKKWVIGRVILVGDDDAVDVKVGELSELVEGAERIQAIFGGVAGAVHAIAIQIAELASVQHARAVDVRRRPCSC